MNGGSYLIVLVLCLSVWCSIGADQFALPSDFPTCRRNDPELNVCARSAFQEWLERTKHGIESLGIPAVDPLKIGRLNYAYDNGIFKGVIQFRKVIVRGIGESIVERVNFQFNETTLSCELDTFAPKINIIGNYAADLQIQQYTFTPKGAFNLTFHNITFMTSANGDLYDRDNLTFWNITQLFTPLPEVGDMDFNITGLFQDANLNEISTNYVRTNWRRILNIIWPETWKMWEPFLQKQYNQFFEIAPLEWLFPKD